MNTMEEFEVVGYGVATTPDPGKVHVNLQAPRWMVGAVMTVKDARALGRMLQQIPSDVTDAEILSRAVEIVTRRYPDHRPRAINSMIINLQNEADTRD